MIKFFRKIRKKLADDNKPIKYFRYAFGEIILVVIGILIALSINNWNEKKKINDSVKNHLSILQQNLKEDRLLLNQLLETTIENFNYADSLMMFFKRHIPFDSKTTKYLSKSLLEYQFRPNTNAIETISQSNEVPFLQPELRTAILDYYALIEKTKSRELISNKQIIDKYEPHIFKYYPNVFQKNNEWQYVKNHYIDDLRPITKINLEKLISDKTLEAYVIARHYHSTILKDLYASLIDASNRVLIVIEEETSK